MIRKTDPQTISPYLIDASNYSGGSAEEVIIPESEDELILFLKNNELPITVAGAGTGVTASRIPDSGLIISLERLSDLGEIENGFIDAGPAVSLAQLNAYLETTKYFYPPNPTETLASIGGTLATNASGSRSYKYGSTRDYVLEADIVLADGRSVSLGRNLSTEQPLKFTDGTELSFPEINYTSPTCKNAAGYYVRPGMDWLDLFIGSDGTLGMFTRIRLMLLPRPYSFISGVLFFENEADSWHLVDSIRNTDAQLLNPCSLEYFDKQSLDRLRSKFDNIPANAEAALFFENDILREEEYDLTLEAWCGYLEGMSVLLDDSWFAQTPGDLRRFNDFRHAIPALLNEENSRRGRIKMGTDMAVSDNRLIEMMNFYKDVLEKQDVDYAIFGHLGDNHLHINLLPESDQIDKAQDIYNELVKQILAWNGTVSAEHGIGKLKKKYFSQMLGQSSLEELKALKSSFDPDFILGRGNIF